MREGLEAFLERERAQLPLWFVVAFGSGIGLWFALDGAEQWLALILLSSGLCVGGFGAGSGRTGQAAGWLGLGIALGCGLVWLRSEWVAAPRLERPRVVSFDARVEKVETLAARGDVRLTLRPLATDLPPRVRVTLKQEAEPAGLGRGATVAVRARLAPPPPMALPGTHDFARDAWFRGIGAVGRALGPVTVTKPARSAGLDSVRDRLSSHVRARLPGPAGGIANALATGDQNAVTEDDAEAMRRSGLAHLLSVSGLHIAAVVGAAMLVTMKLLALSERLALRYNLVLIAAGAGAIAGIGYTLLTGAQVPTVRSCIAALLVLGGIALGRDAISLRLVAVGALLVLLFRPESIAGPSFQLSFAAVTAIIALHSSPWARRVLQRRDDAITGRWGRVLLGMIATGLAVEIALIPFALYHFHKAGLYGVAANLLAIPLTTFVIMPAEALALLFDPVGLGAPFWSIAGAAIDLLLSVAHAVAGARGSVTTMAAMPTYAFASMVLGGLWLCLWTTRARLLGLVPLACGAVAAAIAPTPDLLVTGDGRHLAVRDASGVPLLLRERSGDFIRDLIAESSGFDDEPQSLDGRPFSACSRDSCSAVIERGGRRWHVLATRSSTRIDWRPLVDACAEADIVVSDRWLPKGCAPRWLKLDRKTLEATGGVAVFLGERAEVRTVAESVGRHPWAM